MPLRDDLLNPIAGDNPSGVNLRYDPVTDKIKEARREDLDVPQGEWKTALKTADHPLAIKLGGEAVAKKGKDLQIAVWLVDSHIRREGFALLAPSFQFLHHLLEDFWDTLYPEIDEDGDMEVRAAPLDWLGGKLAEPLRFIPIVSSKMNWLHYQESRLVGYEADADTSDKQSVREARISEGKITAEQFDEAAENTSRAALKLTAGHLQEGLEALAALSEYCDMQFGNYSPSFIKTRESIEEIAQTVRILLGRKPPEPGELEEEAAAAEDEFASDVVVGGAAEATTFAEMAGTPAPAAAPGDIGGAAEQLASICAFLRSRDAEDPTPYLILRNYAWANLMLQAPLLDHGAIEAPPSYLRLGLKRSAAEGDWDKVLEQTEAAMLMACGRTWLDLQRYTAKALEQKGYAGTSRVVNTSLRVLLETLPDVLDVTLPDDTPAANAETRDWITNFVIIQRYTPDPSEATEESTSSDDSSSSDYSLDSSSDSSSDFSLDSSSGEETPSESTPEPEPEPYTVEDNPPILDAEEPPPSDESDEFGQALAAVKDGRTAEGLSAITAILATERSGRARFRRRTQLAHLLMAAGKGKVAQPILDQICAEIEERRLEDWEPGEALAYPLELLLHCLSPADERRLELYARICKLDPVRGVNVSV
jgi:type VI secretion system protein ImpA